jgi:hypothetical protein
MMLALYLDEDSMDQRLIHALRLRRMNVTSAFEAGMIERSDEEHLAYATQHGESFIPSMLAISAGFTAIGCSVGSRTLESYSRTNSVTLLGSNYLAFCD